MYPSCKHDWCNPNHECPYCKNEENEANSILLDKIRNKFRKLNTMINTDVIDCEGVGCDDNPLCANCCTNAGGNAEYMASLVSDLDSLCQ